MDKIAAALSMSKRTIYEQFSDKGELVTECLKLFREELDKERDDIRAKSENSFVFLLSMFKMSFLRLNGINIRFLQDVETIFSEEIKRCRLNRPSQIEQMSELIRQSQKDGYVDPTLSSDVSATVYYGMISSLRDKDSYDYSVVSPKDVLKILCTIYFRGIATEKGLKLIAQYVESV